MSLLYDVPRYLSNCFKHLRISDITRYLPYLISVFLNIFKKKYSILCLKLFIYLFNIKFCTLGLLIYFYIIIDLFLYY